ncbi:MAG: mechanosensitive ion channel family protein [Acidimicrobiales bacterium]
MLAQDVLAQQQLSEACGGDPSWLCQLVFEQTEMTWVASIADRGARAVLVLVLAWVVVRVIRRQGPKLANAMATSREAVARTDETDLTDQQRIDLTLRAERARQRTQTIGAVLTSVLAGLVWFLTALLILDLAGVNLAPLIASAGVAGIAIGFGAQKMVSDFFAGLFIVLEDQYGVGDVVDLGDASGTVEQVNLRVTRLRDVNGVVWYVPNSEIQRVGNMSQLWSRAVLDIDVSYDTDLDEASRILKEEADRLWHERLPDMSIIDEPEVWGVERFGADGITIRLVIKTEPIEQWKTARELRRRIKVAFDQASIEIPFPQRTVWVKNDTGHTAADGTVVDTPASGGETAD